MIRLSQSEAWTLHEAPEAKEWGQELSTSRGISLAKVALGWWQWPHGS